MTSTPNTEKREPLVTESVIKQTQFTRDEAKEFFGKLVGGSHHVYDQHLKEYGQGWRFTYWNDLSTYDFNVLTKFVILCHDQCVRGQIAGKNSKEVYLIIHQRHTREGDMTRKHPTMEDAINNFRNSIAIKP